MTSKQFSPGFRMSPLDEVILAGGACTVVLGPRDVAIVAAMAVGHFFLFCNVCRISRPPELIWAAVFILLASSTICFAIPPWPVTAGVSLALAGVLIALETKKPSYHGIAWKTLNPNLPAWWQSHKDV